MQPLAVMEALDVAKDLGPRLLARGKGLVMGELLLQGTEEAFHGRVVVGNAFAAHARREPRFLQLLLIGFAGVLRALVAVVDGAFGRRATPQGHGERRAGECLTSAGLTLLS